MWTIWLYTRVLAKRQRKRKSFIVSHETILVFVNKLEKLTLLQVGVRLFLKKGEGKYLILKRSPVRYPNIANFWDIPGGRIIPGTILLENIKREVFEETKLSVQGEPKLVYAQDILHLPEKHIVRLTCSGVTSKDPVLDSEHVVYRWVTLDEMRAIPKLDEFTREVLGKNISASI